MTQEAKTTVLDAFLKQRAKRQNNTVIEARRLVNLYRHLSLFGADYLEKYNAMLMAATPEVQMALSDIIGGTIVRQYLEFLKGRAQKNETNEAISDEEAGDAYRYRHEESYLPSPDELPPFVFSPPVGGALMPEMGNTSSEGHAFATPTMDGAVLSMQEAFFEKALSKQSVFLTEALEKIQQSAMKQAAENSLPDAVLTELSALQQTQKEALSELLAKQNEQFVENLNNILKQTQDLSTRQMEMVERLVENNNKENWERDAYAIIEDDVHMTPKVQETPQRNRSYRPDAPVFSRPEVELEPVGEDIALVSEQQTNDPYRSLSLVTPNQTDEENK
ncbi:MAG: hypothetical protein IKY98_05660 [Alphaproteobacteria bacterium]|nr:hypothetical protein [Alphaproteobacteria bacterium]